MRKSSKCLSVLALCLLSLGLLLPGSQAQTSVQPFRTPAWQISVYSNNYRYPNGAGANWTYIRLGGDPTNLNVQAVFNWLDSNWIHVVDQQLSTNGWTFLMPTQSDVQAVFNWIDENMDTNYLTEVRGSNLFISSTDGQVSNRNLAANSVTAANITNGTIGIDDLRTDLFGLMRVRPTNGWRSVNASLATSSGTETTACTSGGGCIGVGIPVTATNFVSKTTFYTLRGYNTLRSSAAGGLDVVYWTVKVGSTPSTVNFTLAEATSMTAYFTNAYIGSANNYASVAVMSFVVPQSNYFCITQTPGDSMGANPYTSTWALIEYTP